MKNSKNIAFLFLVLFFASCGPKRLGCGPRRCDIKATDIQKFDVQKNPEVKKTSGLV